MAQEFIIRPVEMQDYQPLSELYGYYSLNTVYTYYSHCPTAEYMQQLFSAFEKVLHHRGISFASIYRQRLWPPADFTRRRDGQSIWLSQNPRHYLYGKQAFPGRIYRARIRICRDKNL